MAGAEEVVEGIDRRDGVVYAGLALNEHGYDRLVAAGLDEVHFAFAATETFNRRNQNASVEESVAAAERIAARARADGIRATVTIGVAFGCPFEGAVDPGPRRRPRRAACGRASDEVVFADTIGVAVPRQVRDLLGRADLRGNARRGSPAQHAQHRVRERARRGRGGRDRARRVRRRHRRVPLRAAGDREHRDRGSRLRPPRRGRRDRDRPRRR